MQKTYWIIALIVLFFVGDRLGGWLLKSLVERSQFRYSRLYQGQAAADILLLGNSRGLIFYQPYITESTGKSTFNLSYNGLSIDLGRVLVEDYLDRYPAPQTLLIDVTMCDRENDQLSAGFSFYTPYSPRLDSFLLAKTPTTAYAGRLPHLFRYNSEVFQRSLRYLGGSDEDWLTDRVMNDFLVDNVEGEKGLDFHFTEAKDRGTLDEAYILEQLRATVAAAQARGVKVQLVINPYYPPFAQKSVGYVAWKAKVEQVTGLAIRDYALALSDRQVFGDYQHLNKLGSKRYLDLLKKDGVLE